MGSSAVRWTIVNAGTKSITVPSPTLIVGGHAAGGGGGASVVNGGGGGGGGEFRQSTLTGLTVGATKTMVIPATTAAGADGADFTWDGTVVVAKGGKKGANGSALSQGAGGAGGTGGTGTIGFNGGRWRRRG